MDPTREGWGGGGGKNCFESKIPMLHERCEYMQPGVKVLSTQTYRGFLSFPTLSSTSKINKKHNVTLYFTVADPGFPRGEGANPPGVGASKRDFAKFSPKRHWRHVSLVPLPRFANVQSI